MSENRKRHEEIKEILKRDSTMHFLEVAEIEEVLLEQDVLLDKMIDEAMNRIAKKIIEKNARLNWRV